MDAYNDSVVFSIVCFLSARFIKAHLIYQKINLKLRNSGHYHKDMQDVNHSLYPKSTLEQADGVAWIFTDKDSELTKYPFKFSELKPTEVRLKVLHTSLCFSDVMHSR